MESPDTALRDNQYPQCVGCGYCCITFPCTKSIFIDRDGFPEDKSLFTYDDIKSKRCFFLYWNENRYRCRKIEADNNFYKYMAAGIDCSSSLNSWRKNIIERR